MRSAENADSPRAALRMQIEQLERHSGGSIRSGRSATPSGFPELDARLPGGGWPIGAVAELMSDAFGIGELSLLMPVLSRLAQAGRYIVWIAPPFVPYAPALAARGLPLERTLLIQARSLQETLWASEQALRCPAIGAVLCWPAYIVDRNVRRLQLAAEAGGSLSVLYRPPEAAHESSPAAVRLRLRAAADGIVVEIHKARGGMRGLTLLCRGLDAVAMHPLTATGA